jgi:hypothetical protein
MKFSKDVYAINRISKNNNLFQDEDDEIIGFLKNNP